MNKVLLIVVGALMLSVTGCNRNATKAAMTDADLRQQIEAKVTADPELNSANLSITADAARNTATISGVVDSQELRTKVLDLAKSANPGLVVEETITVKPRELTRAEFTEEHGREERERAKLHKERIGNAINDAWIHATIVTRLVGDANAPDRTINVDVNNGVVTFRGAVDSANEKTEAERISKQTEGVKRVTNRLKISKPSSSQIPMWLKGKSAPVTLVA